jgi:histidinol-phosphatase (PHP family)
VPDEFYDRITEAAVKSGMAAEVSSAGWRKPVGEEYPAPPLLRRFVDAGVPLTTASDAHSLPDVADRAGDLRSLLNNAGVVNLQGYHQRKGYAVPVEEAAPSGQVAGD